MRNSRFSKKCDKCSPSLDKPKKIKKGKKKNCNSGERTGASKGTCRCRDDTEKSLKKKKKPGANFHFEVKKRGAPNLPTGLNSLFHKLFPQPG